MIFYLAALQQISPTLAANHDLMPMHPISMKVYHAHVDPEGRRNRLDDCKLSDTTPLTLSLLRACLERPRRRAAKQRDKLSSL